eukprot:Nk52_evm70s270 gene=Nk52_evmTU70s270
MVVILIPPALVGASVFTYSAYRVYYFGRNVGEANIIDSRINPPAIETNDVNTPSRTGTADYIRVIDPVKGAGFTSHIASLTVGLSAQRAFKTLIVEKVTPEINRTAPEFSVKTWQAALKNIYPRALGAMGSYYIAAFCTGISLPYFVEWSREKR